MEGSIRSEGGLSDLIPYRCPKCGDTKQFTTLRNLKSHLEMDHSYKMGYVTPRSRNTVFSYKTRSNLRNTSKKNSKVFDEMSVQSNNSPNSGSDMESRRSPLLESYKKDAQLLESKLQQAKKEEMRNKLRRNVTDKNMSEYSLHQNVSDYNLRDTINALNHEITQSRQSQWATADALYQSDSVLLGMEEAAEQRCHDQQNVIQDLVLNLKSKDGELQHANESVNMLRRERQKLMHDMEYLYQQNGEDHNKLKVELEDKNDLLSSINQQMQSQKQKASQILKKKDEDLKSAQTRLNQLENEKQKLLHETDNLMKGSMKDHSALKKTLDVKQQQLKQVSGELEKLRGEQNDLLNESIQLYKTASTGSQKLKSVIQAKDQQLEEAYDKLRNVKQAHEQLIWESQQLTDQSDAQTRTLKKILEAKEDMLTEAQRELEKLSMERNNLLQNVKGVNEEATDREQTVVKLQELVEQKQRQLEKKESETAELKDFLSETAQKEAIARKKLEKFISDLIERADKAETELKMIKCQLDSGAQNKRSDEISVNSLDVSASDSQTDQKAMYNRGPEKNLKAVSHSQRRHKLESKLQRTREESSEDGLSESTVESVDSSSHPLKTRDSGVASITRMRKPRIRDRRQKRESTPRERQKTSNDGPVQTSTPIQRETREQKLGRSPRASKVAKRVIKATIEPWHESIPPSLLPEHNDVSPILPPAEFADEKHENQSSSSDLSDFDLSLSISSRLPVSNENMRTKQIHVDKSERPMKNKMETHSEPVRNPQKYLTSGAHSVTDENRNMTYIPSPAPQNKHKPRNSIRQGQNYRERIQSPEQDSTQYSPLPKFISNNLKQQVRPEINLQNAHSGYVQGGHHSGMPNQQIISSTNLPKDYITHQPVINKSENVKSPHKSSNIYTPTPLVEAERGHNLRRSGNILNKVDEVKTNDVSNDRRQRSASQRLPVSAPNIDSLTNENVRRNANLYSDPQTKTQYVTKDTSSIVQLSEDSYKQLPKEIPYSVGHPSTDVVYVPFDRKTGRLTHHLRSTNQKKDDGIHSAGIDSQQNYPVKLDNSVTDFCVYQKGGIETAVDQDQLGGESDGASICLDDVDDQENDNTLSHVKSISEDDILDEEEYSESFDKCMDEDGIIWDAMETVASDQSEMDSQRVSPYGSEMRSLSKPVLQQAGQGPYIPNTYVNMDKSDSSSYGLYTDRSKNVRFGNNYTIHQTISDPIHVRNVGNVKRLANKEKREIGAATSPEVSSTESYWSQLSQSSEGPTCRTSKPRGKFSNMRKKATMAIPTKSTSMFELSKIGNDMNPHSESLHWRFASSLQNLADLDTQFPPISHQSKRDSSTQTWLLDRRLNCADVENIHDLSSRVSSEYETDRSLGVTSHGSRGQIPRSSSSLDINLNQGHPDSFLRISVNGEDRAIDISLFQPERKSVVPISSVTYPPGHDHCKSDSDMTVTKREKLGKSADVISDNTDYHTKEQAARNKHVYSSLPDSVHNSRTRDLSDNALHSTEFPEVSEQRNKETKTYEYVNKGDSGGMGEPGDGIVLGNFDQTIVGGLNSNSLGENSAEGSRAESYHRINSSCESSPKRCLADDSLSQGPERSLSQRIKGSLADDSLSQRQGDFDGFNDDSTSYKTLSKTHGNSKGEVSQSYLDKNGRGITPDEQSRASVTDTIDSQHSSLSDCIFTGRSENHSNEEKVDRLRSNLSQTSNKSESIHSSPSEYNQGQGKETCGGDINSITGSPAEFSELMHSNSSKTSLQDTVKEVKDDKVREDIIKSRNSSVHSSPSRSNHLSKFEEETDRVNLPIDEDKPVYCSDDSIIGSPLNSQSDPVMDRSHSSRSDSVLQYLKGISEVADDTLFAEVQETDDELTSSIDDFRGRLSTVSSIDLPSERVSTRREERRRRRRVLHHVFQYLDVKSLLQVASVCREWKHVSRHPSLWKRVYISGEKCSSQFLQSISKWCTCMEVLALKDVKARSKTESETEEDYNNGIRASLEPGLERLLQVSESSLKSLSIINCGSIFTDKSIWLASCYSRLLKSVCYITNTHPLGADVMWALGAGCRDITSLVIPPLYHCENEGKFNNKCLQVISQFCPDLEELSIGGSQIDINGLVLIAKSCQRLQSMAIHYSPLLDDDTAVAICRMGWKNLRCLSFVHTPVSPAAVQQFYNCCKHLKSIEISLAISDYCSETTKLEDIENWGAIVQQMKELQSIPGLNNILKLNMQTT